MTTGSILGNPVRRVEDPRLLRGDHSYVDDLSLEGVLHAVFVRSPLSHATFTSVETDEAKSMPGVVAVLTAADLGLEPWKAAGYLPDTMKRPVLADGRVRFVGEPIAVVLGETRAQAADAAEMVFADYEPLEAVTDMERAVEEGAPVLFEDHGSNVAFQLPASGEDVLEGADVVASVRIVNQRLAPVPLEVNAFAVATEDGKVKVWASSQAPHGLRDDIAEVLGIDPAELHVVAPDVGGGFGAKGGTYAEHIVLVEACRRLGRPVKWLETRSENMTAMTHGRGQLQYVEIGGKRSGEIVGFRARILQEAGAYPNVGAALPFLTRLMGSGVYRIPKIDMSTQSIVTNTTPTAAYRGAGRPEATALIERAIDVLAAEIGMDPAEIRRKNFIPPDAFPYSTVTGSTYDIGEYDKALSEALRIAGYDELRAEQKQRREGGDARQLGIGLSVYVEMTGQGPTNAEYAAVEVNDDGTLTVRSGASAHGQGHHTAFAQLAAELFGMPLTAVRVIQSDTAEVARGVGTFGSRSLQLGGSALWKAGEAVVDKARQITAHLLEAAPDDIVVHDGGVGVAGAPDTAIPWTDIAKAANDPEKLPEGMEPGLRAEFDFDQGQSTFPFGAHVSVVEVDVETGMVRLRRHIAVDDCGRIVNPMIVRGQQHGGIAQGIGQAMWEEFSYDDDGNPLTGNLAMYGFPTAAELPSFEATNTETPSPLNPLGAKGIGESGTIGSTPAVQNAVVDAVSHLGVRHIDMPLSPERVWRAIQDARQAANA